MMGNDAIFAGCQAFCVARPKAKPKEKRETSALWTVVGAKLAERGWSEAEFAEMLDMPRATMSRWKYADTFPDAVNVDALKRMARLLGMSVDQVLGVQPTDIEKAPVGKLNLEERRLVDWFRSSQKIRDIVRPMMKNVQMEE